MNHNDLDRQNLHRGAMYEITYTINCLPLPQMGQKILYFDSIPDNEQVIEALRTSGVASNTGLSIFINKCVPTLIGNVNLQNNRSPINFL